LTWRTGRRWRLKNIRTDYQSYDAYGRPATISTPAKTVVDCVDRPALAGGPAEVVRIANGASSGISADEVAEVALQMKSTSLIQRLGFIMDLVGWPLAHAARAKMQDAIAPSARSVFGRAEAHKRDIGYVAEWALLVHASHTQLVADLPCIAKGRSG
jgi:predicted transcriptional regulator of viral defense system